MKRILPPGTILVALASILLLPSCVFEKPVFGGGSKTNPAWTGLWTTKDDDGKTIPAALVPLGGGHSLLHYPANADGWYFDAQSVRCRNRELLQLRILAGPDAKIPAADAANFTLLWIEPQPGGLLSVRALGGENIKQAGLDPRSLRKFLAAPDSDWNKVFGDPLVFAKK